MFLFVVYFMISYVLTFSLLCFLFCISFVFITIQLSVKCYQERCVQNSILNSNVTFAIFSFTIKLWKIVRIFVGIRKNMLYIIAYMCLHKNLYMVVNVDYRWDLFLILVIIRDHVWGRYIGECKQIISC